WSSDVCSSDLAPTALVELLRGAPEVEFVPDAEQIGPWYEASQVVLVPLWAGGGTKLKSIEGLVYGKPLVSTRHGMRGLPARAEQHYSSTHRPERRKSGAKGKRCALRTMSHIDV